MNTRRQSPLERVLVAAALLAGLGIAQANDTTNTATDSTPAAVAAKVGAAIERGAQAAAHGIERGAKAAAHGVQVGVSAAARGIARGAEATARAAESVARKVQPAAAPAAAPPSDT